MIMFVRENPMIEVKYVPVYENAQVFQYSREYDACLDMFSIEEVTIKPHETVTITTGITVEIPVGNEGIVRGRSGLSSKGLLTHIGTIDENYRGEVKVIMTNLNDFEFYLPPYSKIAQLAVRPCPRVSMVKVDWLSSTERGSDGFGSSGM